MMISRIAFITRENGNSIELKSTKHTVKPAILQLSHKIVNNLVMMLLTTHQIYIQ